MIYSIGMNDGSVRLMRVASEDVDPLEEVKKWADRSSVQSINSVNEDDVPEDRTFREAWKHDLTVDMDKAREIHMGRIRALRDVKLKKLDIETMKGKDVQAEKQVLRDIPQTFDLSKAGTPDELKLLIPEELKS